MSLASIAARDPLAAFCIGRTLPLEGGFTDDPADNGGATNRGVSLRFALAEVEADPQMIGMFDIDHDGHITDKDISGLTQDDAAEIYLAVWWSPGWYKKLAPAQMLAWKCFDIAVNTGPKRAALILQKALPVCGDYVFPDASVGPATLAACQRQIAMDEGQHLLDTIRAQQADFYSRLVAKEPKMRRFLDGWLKRAAA